MSAKDINDLSISLLNCKMPHEIHRKARDLKDLPHWKGTEYRTFLLYTGIVVLKNIMSYEVYQHFLLLVCAATICETQTFSRYLPVAKMLIDHFIECWRGIYAEDAYITSNVHNLIHMVDDVTKFGELSTFSAYPFETTLGCIKRLLRKGHRPLAQVAKRIIEKTRQDCAKGLPEAKNNEVVLTKPNKGGNVPPKFHLATTMGNELGFYSKIDLGDFCLATDAANKWFLTRTDEIACVENILAAGNKIALYCRTITNKKDFFNTPVKSSALNIFAINYCAKETHAYKMLYVHDIKCKFVFVEYKDEREKCDVLIPLLHTYCQPTA